VAAEAVLRVVSIILRNDAVMQRTAIPPARRWHLRKNTTRFLRNGGGTPLVAASFCVTNFFATFFLERKTFAVRCNALHYGISIRYDGNQA